MTKDLTTGSEGRVLLRFALTGFLFPDIITLERIHCKVLLSGLLFSGIIRQKMGRCPERNGVFTIFILHLCRMTKTCAGYQRFANLLLRGERVILL